LGWNQKKVYTFKLSIIFVDENQTDEEKVKDEDVSEKNGM